MKTNFVNFTFASLTILLIAGCASATKAPIDATLGHCHNSRVVRCLLRSG